MATLFVEHLTTLDCGLLDPSCGLTGQSWIVDVTLDGALDDQGMIFDFGPAKRAVKSTIDTAADHKLIVPMRAAGLEMHGNGDPMHVHFVDATGGRVDYRGPAEAVCRLDAERVEPDMLARALESDVAAAMPANVSGVRLDLREETIAGAGYRYCHGLHKHAGDCQRIAHGHRSRLEIYVDGERSPAHETRWADLWRDIYLGNRSVLQSDPNDERYRFAYSAPQGDFGLELDAHRCALLDADTTVENIAAHIARQLKREQPDRAFTVRAYEGVHKGAIATA